MFCFVSAKVRKSIHILKQESIKKQNKKKEDFPHFQMTKFKKGKL